MDDRITLANARTVSQGIGAFTQVWRSSKSMSEVPGNLYNSMTGGTNEKATQNSNGGQESAKIKFRNNEEGLQQLYPSNSGSKPGNQRASLDDVHDSFAFSPEALALMG